MLVDELKRVIPTRTVDIEISAPRLRITSTSSRILQGVTYHWTSFAPPGTSDVLIEVVAASWGNQLVPLRTPTDWVQLAELSRWRAISASDAVAGCAEMVGVAGPMRSSIWPPLIISDTAALNGEFVEDRERLISRVTFPQVNRIDGGWRVEAWFLEEGRATQYVCTYDENGIALVERTSISGAGFPSIGP